MKALGIDYGTKRVGIALSDDTGSVAFPREVLENNDVLIEHIHSLCKEGGVQKIVIGESKNFDGEPNSIMLELGDFRAKLGKAVSVPIFFEPEFSTTAAARQAGSDDSIVDAHAAALILQRHLDKPL